MSERRVINVQSNIPITPQHINANEHLWNSFDHSETEVSAGWIVRFFQSIEGGWRPFAYEEINAFYSKKHKDGFTFNRLIDRGWVVLGEDGKYRVTDDFVLRCHMSSPA